MIERLGPLPAFSRAAEPAQGREEITHRLTWVTTRIEETAPQMRQPDARIVPVELGGRRAAIEAVEVPPPVWKAL